MPPLPRSLSLISARGTALSLGVPLVLARSYGLCGYVRLSKARPACSRLALREALIAFDRERVSRRRVARFFLSRRPCPEPAQSCASIPLLSQSEHCVIESKPDNTLDDLRLLSPWPELTEYAAQV